MQPNMINTEPPNTSNLALCQFYSYHFHVFKDNLTSRHPRGKEGEELSEVDWARGLTQHVVKLLVSDEFATLIPNGPKIFLAEDTILVLVHKRDALSKKCAISKYIVIFALVSNCQRTNRFMIAKSFYINGFRHLTVAPFLFTQHTKFVALATGSYNRG